MFVNIRKKNHGLDTIILFIKAECWPTTLHILDISICHTHYPLLNSLQYSHQITSGRHYLKGHNFTFNTHWLEPFKEFPFFYVVYTCFLLLHPCENPQSPYRRRNKTIVSFKCQLTFATSHKTLAIWWMNERFELPTFGLENQRSNQTELIHPNFFQVRNGRFYRKWSWRSTPCWLLVSLGITPCCFQLQNLLTNVHICHDISISNHAKFKDNFTSCKGYHHQL